MNAIKSFLTCLLRRDDIYVVVVQEDQGNAEALLATHSEDDAIEYLLQRSSIHSSERLHINRIKLI